MKKYRVTKKHEFLKENIILEYHPNVINRYFLSTWVHDSTPLEIVCWKENDWIEEVQEPEYTKQDMINFAKFC